MRCYETLAQVLPLEEGSDSVAPFQTHADVKTEPHSPPIPPTRGGLTSTDSIEVVVTELAGVETGGDAILSYHVEYDGGTGGSAWTELQGYTSNSLALSVVKTGLTVSTAYQVRYRTRNQFGWSAGYSSAATISTLTEPGQVEVSTITATLVGTNVEVTWSAPASNGSPLLGYEILFPATAGAEPSAEDTAYCDGSDAAVVAATECTIPISQFWLATTGTPFGFTQGQQLSLKIRASNSMGSGAYSSVLSGGPIIETVPDTPSTAPSRDEAGTTAS